MQALIILTAILILGQLYGWAWDKLQVMRIREAQRRRVQQRHEKFWRQWIELDAE